MVWTREQARLKAIQRRKQWAVATKKYRDKQAQDAKSLRKECRRLMEIHRFNLAILARQENMKRKLQHAISNMRGNKSPNLVNRDGD